jgi:hypothetical protein
LCCQALRWRRDRAAVAEVVVAEAEVATLVAAVLTSAVAGLTSAEAARISEVAELISVAHAWAVVDILPARAPVVSAAAAHILPAADAIPAAGQLFRARPVDGLQPFRARQAATIFAAIAPLAPAAI